MLRSLFTIGWRNIWRSKGYSMINISGLAIGMAVSMIIGLWVSVEFGANKSFRNYERIGLLYHHLSFGGKMYSETSVPLPLGNELKSRFPEVEDVAMTSNVREQVISYGEKRFAKNAIHVEPSFALIFSLNMTDGVSTLTDPGSLLLSKSLAIILLGDDPIGKTIRLSGHDQLTVSGVFEDFPATSQFHDLAIILPMSYKFAGQDSRVMDNWDDFNYDCFVLLRDKKDFQSFSAKIAGTLNSKLSENTRSMKPKGFLHPMEKWNLYGEFKDGVNTGGKIRYVRIFAVIGIFILILGCINFVNLSTARSARRSKEVGIRKVLGSFRSQIIRQFLSESLLMVILAFVVAVIIVLLCSPAFNNLADAKIELPWGSLAFWAGCVVFILITSLLAGSYPAWYLSAFAPVLAMRGATCPGRWSGLPRKALVVFQFAISIALIITTAIVLQQVEHGRKRFVGFDREGIIQLAIRTDDLAKANYNSLRNDLLQTGVVANMAKSDFPMTGAMAADPTLSWEGKDRNSQPLIAQNLVSHDFPATNGFQFVEGRDFSRDRSSDSTAVIINQMAARLMSDKSPVGMKIRFGDGREREVIGVFRDQIRWTPFTNQSPHIYYIDYRPNGTLTIRLGRGVEMHDALRRIESVIKKHDAIAPFDYKFQDDDYRRLFRDEERAASLVGIFAVLAIFISAIGIFGLAAFSASLRTKEIGIRKVLGASLFYLWKLLSAEFALLVLIAAVLAAPAGWYFGTDWLAQYDYRVVISWWIFPGAAAGALLLTLFTVSYQTLKAALANPIETLRSE